MTPAVTVSPRAGVLAPALLMGVVFISDGLLLRLEPNLLLTGALDESAHLATTALALSVAPRALLSRRNLRAGVTVLAASVLIDLDHVPLYLGIRDVAPSGRPLTHSLITPLLLLAVARMLPPPARRLAAAAALGVCLHFVRDLATGPGVPLYWPIDWHSVRLPYPWYVGVVVVLGVLAIGRTRYGQRRG